MRIGLALPRLVEPAPEGCERFDIVDLVHDAHLLRRRLLGNRRRRTPAAVPTRHGCDGVGEQRGYRHLHRGGLGLDDPIHRRRHLPLPGRRNLVSPATGERQAQRLVQVVEGRGVRAPAKHPAAPLRVRCETSLGERLDVLVDHRRGDPELAGERGGRSSFTAPLSPRATTRSRRVARSATTSSPPPRMNATERPSGEKRGVLSSASVDVTCRSESVAKS